MSQVRQKDKKFLRIATCFAAAILALSGIYIPKASAAESYFTAEGSTLNIDEVDPTEQDQLVWVTLKAEREMTIHSMHGYFTPVSGEDEELQYYMSWGYSSGIGGLCYSERTGEFDWNTDDCEDDYVGDEGIHVQAGDTLIYAMFEVKDGVDLLKRYMPVTMELAVIDEGAETGKEIRDVSMDAYVRAGRNLSVYKYIMGNGDLDVPSVVVGGTDVEVRIVPEPGNELVYLELNGEEVTDQVQDNVFRVTPGTEDLTFYATFLRIYEVLEGDGGEHIIGSEEPLAFKIDNDLTDFCGTGLLEVDGEYLDISEMCFVDADNQTISLPASFLNTLALGEHSFVAIFSQPEHGTAKASFKIVEEKPGDNEEGAEIEENISIPNSGVLTDESDSAETTDNFVAIAAVAGMVVVVGVLMKKVKRK